VVWVAVSSNPGAFGVVGECPDRGGAAGADAGVAVLRAVDGEAVVSASRKLVRRVGDRDGGGHDAALDVAVAEVRVLMRSGRKPDQRCRDSAARMFAVHRDTVSCNFRKALGVNCFAAFYWRIPSVRYSSHGAPDRPRPHPGLALRLGAQSTK
jgi:hypothetical protein